MRVKQKFSEENQDRLREERFSVNRSLHKLQFIHAIEARLKEKSNDNKDKLTEPVKGKLKKAAYLILSKNKKLSNKSRETLAEEHEKKLEKEEEKNLSNSDKRNRNKRKIKHKETEEKSSKTSES